MAIRRLNIQFCVKEIEYLYEFYSAPKTDFDIYVKPKIFLDYILAFDSSVKSFSQWQPKFQNLEKARWRNKSKIEMPSISYRLEDGIIKKANLIKASLFGFFDLFYKYREIEKKYY